MTEDGKIRRFWGFIARLPVLYPTKKGFFGESAMERSEAKKLGLTRYFTGRLCSQGHVCERYTLSLQCVECSNRISKERYHAGKPKNTRTWVRGNNPARPSASPEARARYESSRFQKLKSDPDRVIRKYLRSRFWNVMNGRSKAGSVLNYVGCSVAEMRQHLAAHFLPGMTWDNYGEWHVDHIRPCASFDLTDLEQVRQCWHYTNLQPLWARHNCSKGAKYVAG